jgi:hypothetical protein
MATPTWTTRELPILEAIAEAATSAGGSRWEDIVARTGLPAGDVQLALRRLYENDWIDGMDVTSMSGGFELLDIRLLEPALRAVGTWPADPYVEFVAIIQRQIVLEHDPAQRGRLERLLAAVAEVGQGVATAVLTDVVKQTIGL